MTYFLKVIFLLAVFVSTVSAKSVETGLYVAFSLKGAERQIGSSSQASGSIAEMGGITRVAGMVYDRDGQDIIVVGQTIKGEQGIRLDDFVVALRALLNHKQWPLVSIDREQNSRETGTQKVRFEGGIENTRFGHDLLKADVVLKELALGLRPTETLGLHSYLAMSEEYAKGASAEESTSSRFWFYPREPSLAEREGVFVIREMRVGVKTQVVVADLNGKTVPARPELQDRVGQAFAGKLSSVYNELGVYYPEVRRLKSLFDLVALAKGVESLHPRPSLKYWLKDYRVELSNTPRTHPLIIKRLEIRGRNKARVLEIEGGIELKALLIRLRDGDITALRDAVIKSKPSRGAVTWSVPLKGWRFNESDDGIGSDGMEDQGGATKSFQGKFGMNLTRNIGTPQMSGRFKDVPLQLSSSPLQSAIPAISFSDRLPPQHYSPNIGGVMLSDVAQASGSGKAKVNLSSGNFSLVVDGKDAMISPQAYRKFITALWSVYYSQQDPGISIDPIEPGGRKHLVRYIGKVMNTDLGRVMREADYLMKRWAVGTERANIQGFKNPDDISGRKGHPQVGVWSRFWFVPESMRFSRGGNALLFDSGHMTVKTEYMFTKASGRADPSNEEFARLLTTNYQQIAKKYPVYDELFEYAKMVSLAKYLKEQNIPLYWFLMANKDLVLTEDSPGTVDALVKGSDYFKGVTIEGGVNLSFDSHAKGTYRYDQEAVSAINQAISKMSPPRSGASLSSERKEALAGSEPFSFYLGKGSYTVVPQHSLTAGKDRRGVRYQTDLAVKDSGLQLTTQALNGLRHELVRREMARQLLPLSGDRSISEDVLERKAEGFWAAAKEKADRILKKLDRLKDIKYSNQGDFLKALKATMGPASSKELAPLIMKSAFFSTNLELVRYFRPGEQTSGEFGSGWHLLIPYRIKPLGKTQEKFRNVMVQKEVALQNLLTGEDEILKFSADRYAVAGYFPVEGQKSQIVGLALMTDGSSRLVDKLGNEFAFSPSGYLTDMMFSEDHRIHIEYLHDMTNAFDEAPYLLKPADDERVKFRNVSLPKRMTVKNNVSGLSEVLTFSEKGTIVGYVPDRPDRSKFRMLALLSDASFQLVDAGGNEMTFSPSGRFLKMAVSAERPMVRSMSQGNQTISFTYATDKSGKVIIASASIIEGKDGAKPTHTVKYGYDDEGRLCGIGKGDTKKADLRTASLTTK